MLNMLEFPFETVVEIIMKIKKLFNNRIFKKISQIVLCVALIFAALLFIHDIKSESGLSFFLGSAENPLISALIVLLLYAIKSVTVFIPIIALELMAGSVFSPLLALAVNLMGIIICYTIPYYIGKRANTNYSDKLFKKYPKLDKFIRREGRGVFFPAIFLRCIGFLPADLVSAYLGTSSLSYFKYITGSLLGSALRLVAVTILGTSLNKPASLQFILSVTIVLLLTLLSAAGYIFYQKKKDM